MHNVKTFLKDLQRITMKLSMYETVNLSNLQGLFSLGNRLGFLSVSIPLERDQWYSWYAKFLSAKHN